MIRAVGVVGGVVGGGGEGVVPGVGEGLASIHLAHILLVLLQYGFTVDFLRAGDETLSWDQQGRLTFKWGEEGLLGTGQGGTYILRRPLLLRKHNTINNLDPRQPSPLAHILHLPQRLILQLLIIYQSIKRIITTTEPIPLRQRPQRRLDGHDDGDRFALIFGGVDADIGHKAAGAVNGFQLFESDILAVERFDHVFLPIDDFQMAILVEFPNITGFEPAVVKGFAVLVLEVEIAFCDWTAADPDFALRVGFVVGVVVEVGDIDEFDFDGAGHFAECLIGPGGWIAYCSHAIELHERVKEN